MKRKPIVCHFAAVLLALGLPGCRLPEKKGEVPPPQSVYVAPLLVQIRPPGSVKPQPHPSLSLQLAAWEELESAMLTRPGLFRPLALPQDAGTVRFVETILSAPEGGLFPSEIPRAMRVRIRDGVCLAYGIADVEPEDAGKGWQARVQLTWVEDGTTGYYTLLAGSGGGATPRQAIRAACDALLLKLAAP